MAKKQNPTKKLPGDVILVYNQNRKDVRVVSGVDQQGILQSVEPTPENESHYMQVDKNASMFSNFWKNFIESIRSPLVHLQFYKSDKKEIKENVEVIKNALQNKTPEGDKILKVLSELTQLVNKEKEMAKKKEPYIDLNKVNWKELEEVGFSRKIVEEKGQTERMEKGLRSNVLFHLKGDLNGIAVDDMFVMLLIKRQDGTIRVKADGVAHELSRYVMGTPLNDQQMQQLINGRLEGTINIVEPGTRNVREAYLTYDPLVNKAIPMFKSPNMVIWDDINGHKVTVDEKGRILGGFSVKMADLKPKEGGESYGAYAYIDAIERGLKIDCKKYYQELSEDVQKVCRAKQINGKEVTPKQLQEMNAGNYVWIDGMTKRHGKTVEPYGNWIGWKKKENGRYGYDFQKFKPNPKKDKGQNARQQQEGKKFATKGKKVGITN